MNYKKHHDLIIERAKNRTLKGYKERHHIVPRCIGGTDDVSNLVDLTAREHFVVHQLLVKIYPKEYGLSHAANMMLLKSKNSKRNNRVYEWVRIKHSESVSKRQKGQIYYHNPETKKVIRIDKDKIPPEGFIKGRGYSPLKGIKTGNVNNPYTFKNKEIQKELNKRRWNSYYENIMKRNNCSSLELAKRCMVLSIEFRLSDLEKEYGITSPVYRTLLKRHDLPTSKFNQRLFVHFSTTNKDIIKEKLYNEFNFNGKRPPYKKIRQKYKYMSNHILRKILKE